MRDSPDCDRSRGSGSDDPSYITANNVAASAFLLYYTPFWHKLLSAPTVPIATMVTIYNHLAAIKCRRALTGLRVVDAPEDKNRPRTTLSWKTVFVCQGPLVISKITTVASVPVCLVLGEDCPQLAVGSSGHERNVRKKGSRNFQLTENVYS